MKTAMPFAMEGVKILEAYLLKQGAQNDVKLSLPAADYELLDALEKAGITNERDIYSVKVTGSKASYLPQFIPDSANLYELNILAGRLAAMSAWELDCFEGMVMMDALKTDYAPIMVERLINMTHSTADCQIAYEAHDDETLGRFYDENDFVPELEVLSEKAFSWLDFSKIGKELREAEGGVFTSSGYVVHSGEMIRQYSSENLIYPQKPDYVFLLEIATLPQSNEPNDQNCVTVKLPCTEETRRAALSKIGADSIEGCCFYKYESTLPQLSEAFGFLEDIDQLNELAHVFTGFTKEQACIYKAILNAAPKDITIPEALELSGQIQNFSVIREASTPAEYAQYMLSKYCIEQQDELFSCANLQRYGEKLIAEKGIVLTDYGVLWSMDGQTVEQCLNRESPEFMALLVAQQEQFDTLLSQISDGDLKKAVAAYDAHKNVISGTQLKAVYKAGALDAVKLLKTLGVI